MENEQQQSSATTVCRAGCGFYGSSATDGLCSKCFKDQLKRTQEPVRLASPALSSSMAPTSSTTSTPLDTADMHSCAKEALAKSDVTRKMESQEAANLIAPPTAETALSESAAPTGTAPPPTAAAVPVKKGPNKCHQCKKRVGLTGFSCRCGGLYCGEHRYDQAHNCQFDYKTMERETIRKNNPVVVSDKIQRI